MISEKKLEANRQNAQKSTGPRTPEGKAAVSLNSITHGVRARNAVMLVEDPNEFRKLCAELYEEWQPRTATEANLVEQLAVYQWKLGRMEALISNSSLQSTLMCAAFRDPNEFKTDRGTILYPDLIDRHEQGIHRTLNQIDQHQARLQKAYYTSLETLQRLQANRRERELLMQPQPEAEPPETVRVAAAGASSFAPEIWLPSAQTEEPEGAVRRRFGNTWLHRSGLPEDL